MPTVVVAVAVLLPGVVSFGEDTVALFVIEPGVFGAVTVIVRVAASVPEAILPVKLQVTAPDTLEHAHPAPVPDT